MEVKLYNNRSDHKRPVKDLVLVRSVTADIKGACSISDPVLILDYSSVNFNYIYVPAWNRYYDVVNHTVTTGGRVIITGKSDALASFWNDTKNLSCLILRSEADWNKDIYDPDLTVNQKQNTVITNFGRVLECNNNAKYIIGVS